MENRNVIDLFEESVLAYPRKIGIINDDKCYYYHEINQKANFLAHRLLKIGAKEGAFVGVLSQKSEYLIFSILAILKIGCVYVPLTPSYPQERMKYIIENSGLSHLIVDAKNENRVSELSQRLEILSLDSIQKIENNYLSFSDINPVSSKNRDTVYMFYTSGSTGNPKGVLIHQAGFYNRMVWQKKYFNVFPEDNILFKSPIGFDISMWEIFLPLISGATMIISKEEGYMDVDYLSMLLRKHKITVVQFVPSLLRIFLNKIANENSVEQIKLQRVVSSGEELTQNLVKRFYDVLKNTKLYNFYGPTETSICVTAKELNPIHSQDLITIGTPIQNANVYLLDSQSEIIDKDYEKGELYITGVCVGNGYQKLDEETKKNFLPNFLDNTSSKVYKTGDIAKYVKGELVYVGRKDRTVKISGNRVDLGEIEAKINAIPFIEASAVKAIKRLSNNLIVVFYKLANELYNLNNYESEIKRHLKLSLPHYMIPQKYIKVKEFKLTYNGKIDHSELSLSEETGNVAFQYNTLSNNNFLSNLFKKFTGLATVDFDDDFFEVGGSSIEAIELLEEVNSEFNTAFSFNDMADKLSINEILQKIATIKDQEIDVDIN